MIFKRKELSYVNSVIFKYLLNGCGWFFYAITYIFKEYTVFDILSTIFIFIAVLTTLIVLITKHEDEDEMAQYNLHKAKAITYDLSYLALLIVGTYVLLFHENTTFDFMVIYPVIAGSAGALEIIMSCIFIYLEKAGD